MSSQQYSPSFLLGPLSLSGTYGESVAMGQVAPRVDRWRGGHNERAIVGLDNGRRNKGVGGKDRA